MSTKELKDSKSAFWFGIFKDLITIFGTLVAVAVAFGLINKSLPTTWQTNNYVSDIQISVANSIVPSGYSVTVGSLPYVPIGGVFQLVADQSVILKQSRGISTVGLRLSRHAGYSGYAVIVNGQAAKEVAIGDHYQTFDDCFVWPTSTVPDKQAQGGNAVNFQYVCQK